MEEEGKETFLPVATDLLIDMLVREGGGKEWEDMAEGLRIVVGVYYDRIAHRIRKAMEGAECHPSDLIQDMLQLFTAAQYGPLTEAMYKDAEQGQYSFKFPCDILWDSLDTTALTTYYRTHLGGAYLDGTLPPQFSKHLLVLVRGASQEQETSLFITEKINLLIEVIWAKLLAKIGVLKPDTTAARHVAHRTSLEDICRKEGVLNVFLKKITISEPTFKRVIVVHFPKEEKQAEENKDTSSLRNRKESASSPEASTTTGHGSAHVSLYANVPYGDLEGAFPFKDVHLRPLDKLTVVGMGLAAVVVILMTLQSLWEGEQDGSGLMLMQIFLVVVLKQVSTLFTTYTNLRTAYMREVHEWVQQHNTAVGMPVVSQLIDDVKAQEVKELMLAYFFLWKQGPSSSDTLDRVIEAFLLRKLGLSLNFDIEDALNKLTALKIASKTDNVFQITQTPQQWTTAVPTAHLAKLQLK
eukprot:TRINITY_DN6897_c0_g1_i1.p1 TRINITY_DN6897_c0_g1~~TRINITY_DN6897_c0_g1_i1.p1  ORF type:complete len:468 (+),score=137.27 TRINITY_DN6897_c0_g1_i1:76-1479(+)